MNILICKCDKNLPQEDISLSNLLDIKNLENSLKNNKISMLKNDNYEGKNNEKESISSSELKIIEYPYSKNEINNYKYINNNYNENQIKTKINKDSNQFINSLKMNMIKRSELLFNNKKVMQNKILCSKGDLNSSLKNESLIADEEIIYLNNDETQTEKTEKSMKNKSINKKENNISKKKLNKLNLLINTKQKKPVNKLYFFNSYNNTSGRGSYLTRKSNESMKSWTTKVSTLNNSKKKFKKIDQSNKINSLSIKKFNKKFLQNSLNYFVPKASQGKNIINKNILHSLNNSVENNKKRLFNNLSKEISSNKDNDYNIMNIFNNKRIIKRRVNFKKVK